MKSCGVLYFDASGILVHPQRIASQQRAHRLHCGNVIFPSLWPSIAFQRLEWWLNSYTVQTTPQDHEIRLKTLSNGVNRPNIRSLFRNNAVYATRMSGPQEKQRLAF